MGSDKRSQRYTPNQFLSENYKLGLITPSFILGLLASRCL